MRSNHDYTFLVVTSLIVVGAFHALSGAVLYQSPTTLIAIPKQDFDISHYVFVAGVWVTVEVLFGLAVSSFRYLMRLSKGRGTSSS